MSEYVGILIFFILAGTVAGGMLVLATVLGPKKPSRVKSEPFECGEVPFSSPQGRLTIKFYLIGILFLLFDVELVFLYPWAVAFLGLGVLGLVQMAVFLGILMVGFFYAWSRGALDWQ